jgi:hypothetical protein
MVAMPATGLGDDVAVRSEPVPLNSSEPSRTSVGALSYRGGLELRSDDKRFGGLSGLYVSPDGRHLLAVSDEGSWLEAEVSYDERRFLSGLSKVKIGPLLGTDGRPLASKPWQDAESLALLPDGSAVVGYEHHHRLWRYRGPALLSGTPELLPAPPALADAPRNGSLEALAALQGGGLFALTEEMRAGADLVRGFLWRDGRWSELSYKTKDTPRPSDATTLPDGDVLVLERAYSPVTGLLLRLRRIARDAIKPGAVLDPPLIAELKPPLTVENLEGLAARRGEKGETLLYLVSDDNFNPFQKTLLLMFSLTDAPAPADPH